MVNLPDISGVSTQIADRDDDRLHIDNQMPTTLVTFADVVKWCNDDAIDLHLRGAFEDLAGHTQQLCELQERFARLEKADNLVDFRAAMAELRSTVQQLSKTGHALSQSTVKEFEEDAIRRAAEDAAVEADLRRKR